MLSTHRCLIEKVYFRVHIPLVIEQGHHQLDYKSNLVQLLSRSCQPAFEEYLQELSFPHCLLAWECKALMPVEKC